MIKMIAVLVCKPGTSPAERAVTSSTKNSVNWAKQAGISR